MSGAGYESLVEDDLGAVVIPVSDSAAEAEDEPSRKMVHSTTCVYNFFLQSLLVIGIAIAVPVGLLTSRSKSDAGAADKATQGVEESKDMPSSAPSLSPAPSSEPLSQCYTEYSKTGLTDANAKVVYGISNGALQAPYLINTIDVEYKPTPEPNDINAVRPKSPGPDSR